MTPPIVPWTEKSLWKWSQFGIGTVFALILLSGLMWQVVHSQSVLSDIDRTITRMEVTTAAQTQTFNVIATLAATQSRTNQDELDYLHKAAKADDDKLVILKVNQEALKTAASVQEQMLKDHKQQLSDHQVMMSRLQELSPPHPLPAKGGLDE